MSFVDELRQRNLSNPTTSAQNGNFDTDDIMTLLGHVRDRNLSDYEKKAQFNSDLSLRHNRLSSMLNPETGQEKSPWASQQPNVQFKDNNPDITPLQGAEIGQKGKELGLQTEELKHNVASQTQKQSLAEREFGLEQQKNKQIYDTKQADMQRKIDEANHKLELAYTQLGDKSANQAAVLASHQAIQAAMEERHKLELANKDLQFNESKRLHDAQIAKMQSDSESKNASTEKTTEVNPEGTKKTETTIKGGKIGRIRVMAPEGTVDPNTGKPVKYGMMDAAELKDHPGWTEVK